MIDFIARGLEASQFSHLFDRTEEELASVVARICTVDEPGSFPCRVSLVDAEVGEMVALLPFAHHDVESPYRASGPIFVRRNAETASLNVNEVPEVLVRRLLSFRAYDAAGFMVGCEVSQGSEAERVIQRLFAREDAYYIHVHNARPGCFACRIDRA